MKTRYIGIWKLHGANTLASANKDIELACLSDPAVVVRITADVEPYFARIDEAAALANRLINGLTGVFGGDQGLTFEQAFATEVTKVKFLIIASVLDLDRQQPTPKIFVI